jgi:hypothetical protein
LAFILLLVVTPLLAAQTSLVDDVIRMSKVGVGDDAIIAFIQATRDRPAVTADDLIAMSEAGVSKAVIQAMLAAPVAPQAASGTPTSDGAQAENPPDQAAPPPPYTEPPPDQGVVVSVGVGCWVFDPPIYYGPYGSIYPSPLWDPFWYQPRLDTKSGAPASRGPAGAPPIAPLAVDRDHDRHPSGHHEKSTPAPDTRSHDSGDRPHDSGGRSHDSGGHSGGSRHH